MTNKGYIQHPFGNMAAEVQNSTAVFQLNFSNNISFCTSLPAGRQGFPARKLYIKNNC
ncbi:hypothetical protein J2X31_003609 [Flavobacterium arsenatis]|uniref:Uncharacterized protein n=1 Tax=Flavobacterium arsenatis TaxID=1484332 RepID=A0ABU1TUQ2_9FLAO|nr:hypothetical protein [Flavobacterium arsenatis]